MLLQKSTFTVSHHCTSACA